MASLRRQSAFRQGHQKPHSPLASTYGRSILFSSIRFSCECELPVSSFLGDIANSPFFLKKPPPILRMSVAVMPHLSRASTSSSSSHVPISRQNTVSSSDGRSARQSKRYSTALYLSMSAKEKDLEIEDELARGRKEARYQSCAC